MWQNLEIESLEGYYNKAIVLKDEGEHLLISYETKIMVYYESTDKFIFGNYIKRNAISNTTNKHIKAFLNYIGGEYVDKNLKYILKKGNYVYMNM